MTNNRKRRKRSDYGPDLPIHKDYNVGHWRGFRGVPQLRRCNECGHEVKTHLTAHKIWCPIKKGSKYCGTLKIVRKPVRYKLRYKEEEK